MLGKQMVMQKKKQLKEKYLHSVCQLWLKLLKWWSASCQRNYFGWFPQCL